jgi:hypothetical protein
MPRQRCRNIEQPLGRRFEGALTNLAATLWSALCGTQHMAWEGMRMCVGGTQWRLLAAQLSPSQLRAAPAQHRARRFWVTSALAVMTWMSWIRPYVIARSVDAGTIGLQGCHPLPGLPQQTCTEKLLHRLHQPLRCCPRGALMGGRGQR